MSYGNLKAKTELSDAHYAAIKHACSLVAPNWPLDRFIAVNALWEYRSQPVELVSARLAALADISTTMTADYFLDAYSKGKISDDSLLKAADAYNLKCGIDDLKAGLHAEKPGVLLSLAEIADLKRDHHKMQWQDEVIHQISQFCGDYVIHGPGAFDNLYSAWLDFARHDYGVSLLMGEKSLRQAFEQLPNNYESLFTLAVEELGLEPHRLEAYANKLLLSINGWASYFSWQRWENKLQHHDNDDVQALLAIRLAWDLVVWFQYKHHPVEFKQLRSQWDAQKHELNSLIDEHIEHHRYFWVWTHAMELDYQAQLHHALKSAGKEQRVSPLLQVAMCIDVRSERMRRALESQSPAIQTIGFAGFFGLPVEFQPVANATTRPQLPGLIPPSITVSGQPHKPDKINKLNKLSQWKAWANSSASAFTMVETVGWTYAFKLFHENFFTNSKEKLVDEFSHHHQWHLEKDGKAMSLEDKVSLVTGILDAMGLSQQFAPVVLLLGHGSETRNNLHASGLDCGACGGQTGEVNVRVLAYLLNDEAIRKALARSGITIPQETRFIAGLHNTTTDEISCFESLNDDKLQLWLEQASKQTRQQRVQSDNPEFAQQDDASLAKLVKNKARDWSEVRPEWGLANNASFIVAPRARTQGVDLDGRTFLHDYDWRQDHEFSLLELIMTAPMVVTNWINMQYNLSVVDNSFFGSGNKLLHNAVGHNIGVFEGNGGDLRVGLSMQSVHDGVEWRHQPLRLSVYIAAPREAIEDVINAHQTVHDLVVNNWLFLFRLGDEGEIERYGSGYWERAN